MIIDEHLLILTETPRTTHDDSYYDYSKSYENSVVSSMYEYDSGSYLDSRSNNEVFGSYVDTGRSYLDSRSNEVFESYVDSGRSYLDSKSKEVSGSYVDSGRNEVSGSYDYSRTNENSGKNEEIYADSKGFEDVVLKPFTRTLKVFRTIEEGSGSKTVEVVRTLKKNLITLDEISGTHEETGSK